MNRTASTLLALALLAPLSQAALPTLSDTTTVYRQDFNTLAVTGTADFSSLPDGWSALESGSGANTSFTADSGALNSGNTYSYGLLGATDRALGLLASGSVTGQIQFRIINTSGKSVDSVSVRYSSELWRLGSSTVDTLPLSWAVGTGTATISAALTSRFDSAVVDKPNPNANTSARILEAVLPVVLKAGDTLVLTWQDFNATGSDDGRAIDDFSLRFTHFGDGTVPPPPPPPLPFTSISAIQGSGLVSPLVDSIVRLTGIVTSNFTASTQLKGFHVQAADAQADNNPATSEGVFVYTNTTAVTVAIGDSVIVKGKVAEFNGLTEIVSPEVTVVASGKSLPAAVAISLPLDSLNAPERWEGMRVRNAQPLIVSGNYTLARYGEFVVAPRRRMAPTQVATPGAAAQAAMRADSLSMLVVNDGSSTQNPTSVVYPTGGLTASRTLRTGDRLDSLEGVLDYAFKLWTVQPTRAPIFTATNPRSGPPAPVANSVRVASFNVLNYFTTLGTANLCGPQRSLGCRGANDSSEFRRQKSKVLSALHRMNADVVGLMEIENHATDSALKDLVQGLNDSAGAGTWSAISTGPLGGDAIKVALIYKSARVEPTDSVARLTRAFDADFIDTLNRVALAQTFRDRQSGTSFTVAVNHLKSKGSACAGDADLADGQGNCNQTRTRAARALARWIKSKPTGTTSAHALLIGDFNAYAKEDPIQVLRDSGFTNLVQRDEGDSSYSYQFGNAFGTLDHALATSELATWAKAAHWAINADEPVALGYNKEFKSAAQIDSFYSADPFSSSDHDPVVISLTLPTAVTRLDARQAVTVQINTLGNTLQLATSPQWAGAQFSAHDLSGRRWAQGKLDATGSLRFAAPSSVLVYRIRNANGSTLHEGHVLPVR